MKAFATEKGCALLAAVDSGLIPKTKGGWDTANFEKFWDMYCKNIVQARLASQNREKK